MNKRILIENFVFDFKPFEKGIWYLGNDPVNIFDINKVGIYVDSNKNTWEEVESFLKFLLKNKTILKGKIEMSIKMLHSFFDITNSNSKVVKDLIYSLNSIHFKGINLSVSEGFIYELSFYQESLNDPTYTSYDSWNTILIGSEIKGVNILGE